MDTSVLVEAAKLIIKYHERHTANVDVNQTIPLIIGVQGIQGAGKSTLCRNLCTKLKTDNNLTCISLSLDDFYKDHKELTELYEQSRSELWRYRGLPGSHDIQLCFQTLQELIDHSSDSVLIPQYDKSAFDGEGDRVHDKSLWMKVRKPVDIVLIEGWCLGYTHLVHADLEDLYQKNLNLMKEYDFKSIERMNQYLKELEQIYQYFDAFIVLQAPTPSMAYTWRWQQELDLKKRLGDDSAGMDQEKCRSFVDRFMVCYVLYQSPLRFLQNQSSITYCVLDINESRHVIKAHCFRFDD